MDKLRITLCVACGARSSILWITPRRPRRVGASADMRVFHVGHANELVEGRRRRRLTSCHCVRSSARGFTAARCASKTRPRGAGVARRAPGVSASVRGRGGRLPVGTRRGYPLARRGLLPACVFKRARFDRRARRQSRSWRRRRDGRRGRRRRHRLRRFRKAEERARGSLRVGRFGRRARWAAVPTPVREDRRVPRGVASAQSGRRVGTDAARLDVGPRRSDDGKGGQSAF